MRHPSIVPAGALLLALASPIAAQERHVHAGHGAATGLGTVAFPNSGSAPAQAPFLRGLALLHSFEYDQAAEAFRAAQAADAGFAMAYWGEALTYSHLLWNEDDVDGARRALRRLAAERDARLARAGTPRERAFGEAIEALFVDGTEEIRVKGFADGMRRVAAAYPADPNALSFASLGALFEGNASRAAAIDFAERVFKEHPEHPGGAHYLIHACDNPEYAARGLEAARRYAQIAPEAEHALHMPSHIFVQLGLWTDTVASNERSWAASVKEVSALKLTNADLSFHALLFEQYALLQLGQYGASRAAIAKARTALAGVDLSGGLHVDARYALSELAFQHAANAADWSPEICQAIGPPPAGTVPPGAADRDRSFRIRATYQATMATMMCGRPESALDGLRAGAPAADDPLGAMRPAALRHAELLAYLLGRPSLNLDALLADPATPSRAPVGPPTGLRLEELLGQARLKAGRPREAIAAFERALTLTPNRSATLLGLARARRAAGDTSGAAEAYRKLLDNWKDADPGVPALAEARAGAAAR